MQLYTKKDIATLKAVTPRCIDNWVRRGLLPAPIKLGTAQQARVRFTAEALATLERNLSGNNTSSAA